MWVRWAAWSLAALPAFVAVIWAGDFNPIFLLGWAFAAVVWACIIVFRRPEPAGGPRDPRQGQVRQAGRPT